MRTVNSKASLPGHLIFAKALGLVCALGLVTPIPAITVAAMMQMPVLSCHLPHCTWFHSRQRPSGASRRFACLQRGFALKQLPPCLRLAQSIGSSHLPRGERDLHFLQLACRCLSQSPSSSFSPSPPLFLSPLDLSPSLFTCLPLLISTPLSLFPHPLANHQWRSFPACRLARQPLLK